MCGTRVTISPVGLDEALEEFDRSIGLNLLRAVHLNDSKNPQGSHKDRHAVIGKGTIGLEAMVNIINHPLLRDLPFILETPNDEDGWAAEIALLRELLPGGDLRPKMFFRKECP